MNAFAAVGFEVDHQEGEVVIAVARVTKSPRSSNSGFQDAVNGGLRRASSTVRGITELEIVSERAKVEGDRITEYRVTLELTFILE